MVLKDVRAKVEQGWTTTKKILAALSAWSLIYLVVTTARLGVAYGYDGALVDSAASHAKAARVAQAATGPQYWTTLNNAYDLESPKILPWALAWMFRGLGFRVTILADREPTGGEALKKEWRYLAPRRFVFSPEPDSLHLHLQDGRYVLFFGASDDNIRQARKAGVYPVRVKLSRRAAAEDYHPGSLGEVVLPLSNFAA